MTGPGPTPAIAGRLARVALLAVLSVVTLPGCGLGDPPEAGMLITNDTNEPLAISEQAGPSGIRNLLGTRLDMA